MEFIVGDEEHGPRLDVFLAARLPEYSRVNLRRAIISGAVQVDGRRTKVAYRLRPGEKLSVVLPEMPHPGPQPENTPLDILYEDEFLAAINKPPAMVVHPAKGHWSGTLASALAYHFSQLSTAGGPHAPGIVHRLDRDTSGVIVVAKTDRSHIALASQFQARTVEKEYFAIVHPPPDRDRDAIEQPIGAHPTHREKMAIRVGHSTSRSARTFYEVAERFDGLAAVRVFPKTGRTHQIRVHLAHIGCPVLCDKLYSGRSRLTRGEIRHDRTDDSILLDRLALHARRIALAHPESGQPLEFLAPLPDDIEAVLAELRAHRAIR